LPKLWEDLFLPPVAACLRRATPLRPAAPEIRLEGAGLVFSSMKPAEEGDALVLRCYNARAAATDGRWHLGRPAARAARVRADETQLGELPLEDGGHVIPFGAGPCEIVSVLVSPG
jgi:alpha-mannosidase